MTMNELDLVDVNLLVCALMRREHEAFDSVTSLLNLMVSMSECLSINSKYQLAEGLRDCADALESMPPLYLRETARMIR